MPLVMGKKIRETGFLDLLLILQEKENRLAEMMALVEIQETGRNTLEAMDAERRKQAKVKNNYVFKVDNLNFNTVLI